MAHPSDVQPAQQDEPSVEHCGDRRLLQRREVTDPVVRVLRGLQTRLHFNASQKLAVDGHFVSVQFPWIRGQTGSGL